MSNVIKLDAYKSKVAIKLELADLLAKYEQLKKDYADLYTPGLGLAPMANRVAKRINKVLKQGEQLNNQYKELTGEYYDWRFLNPKLYKVA